MGKIQNLKGPNSLIKVAFAKEDRDDVRRNAANHKFDAFVDTAN